jgi:hypothetical protein
LSEISWPNPARATQWCSVYRLLGAAAEFASLFAALPVTLTENLLFACSRSGEPARETVQLRTLAFAAVGILTFTLLPRRAVQPDFNESTDSAISEAAIDLIQYQTPISAGGKLLTF